MNDPTPLRGSDDPRRSATAGLAVCDPFGRPVDDLRISLTAACDLKCWFCHHEGQSPHRGVLSPRELRSLARTAARLGVRHIKLTGGEPLLRPDLLDIVRHLAPLVDDLSLVTNGQRLAALAEPLYRAGLRRINVSLHTLDASAYHRLTGAPIAPVLTGIRAAVAAGLHPVKVNVAVTRETLPDLDAHIQWAEAEGVALQYIELHAPPTTPGRVLAERVSLLPLEEALSERARAVSVHRLHGRHRYSVESTSVEVTRPQNNAPFCLACRRLRLTHDGFLKPCLMRNDNLVDVLGPLRAGASDGEIERLFREATRRRIPFWAAVAPGILLPPAAAT